MPSLDALREHTLAHHDAPRVVIRCRKSVRTQQSAGQNIADRIDLSEHIAQKSDQDANRVDLVRHSAKVLEGVVLQRTSLYTSVFSHIIKRRYEQKVCPR